LSQKLRIPESDLLSRLERLNREGALRRIGPIINSRKVGGVSTLITMRVPDERLDEVASMVNGYPEVSHNYLRPGKYNLWFTVSAKDRDSLNSILEEIRWKTQMPMLDLPTRRLFKIGVKFDVR
jgi:DNA-binding Lrp family transcriptional regulator